MRASRTNARILLAALSLALCVAGAAQAADGTSCWTLRGVAARMESENRLFLDLGQERRASYLNSGSGLGIAYEHRVRCRWGFEVGLLTADLNSLFIFDSVEPDFWGEARDDVGFAALTLGPIFHLTPGRRADFYLGPLLALPELSAGNYRPVNMLDGGGPDPSFRQEFDAGLAWGAQAGLDFSLREDSPWAINVGARYLDLEVDTGAALAGTIDVDPTIWTVGVSYSPRGCRDCDEPPVDECDELRRELGRLDCELCPGDEQCRGEPTCEECRGLGCVDCPEEQCREICPPRCDECPLPTCDELDCPRDGCPDGQECRGEPTCDEFPELCWNECPDCDELGCDRPDCPPGSSCRPPCPSLCPPGLDCRPEPSCDDLGCFELCPVPTCADFLGLDCPGGDCPEPTCQDCLALACPGAGCPDGQECRGPCLPPTIWHLCCLILAGLLTLWLIWWIFRRRRLPIWRFWLWFVPLVFILGKLWFFKSAVTWTWLWWLLLTGLTLLLVFTLLRLLDRKHWIRLLLAWLLILVLLAVGGLAAWNWLWWFLLIALVVLLATFVWRSVRGDGDGLFRLVALALLIAALVLLGKLAAWGSGWLLILLVLALLLLYCMWRWICRREDAEHPGVWTAWMVALLLAVVYAGRGLAGAWLWWFLLILALAILVYMLRRWLGDRRYVWLILLVLLILLLLLLGKMAAFGWLWWFLLVGLLLLLVCLLLRQSGKADHPGLWLVLIVTLIAVLLLLGRMAAFGWLWWFLLCALGLLLLWAVWRLLGKGVWLLLAVPLVVMLALLGVPAAGAWLAWALLVLVVLVLAYLVLWLLGWTGDPEKYRRTWICLLVLALLALLGLGWLAGWAGHWWLLLLVLALLLAWASWRMLGGGSGAGLAALVWLALLLFAIVLLILLGPSPSSWLWAVLLCALLALLPLAIWNLWRQTSGAPGGGLGVACATGLPSLREFQQGLEPIAGAEPGAVRDLFLAYRDRRGWSDMYALFDRMAEEQQQDPQIRQQLAFALNRDGRDKEAEELLTALESVDRRSAESWGLLGRIYKDRWEAARRLAATAPAAEAEELAGTAGRLLVKAIRTYSQGHRAGEGENPYPGINALTLAEFDDDWRRELRDLLLDEVGAALEAAEPADDSDYWHHATRIELAIHRGREGEARAALKRALQAVQPTLDACPQVWKVETTCRNLRLLEEARGGRGKELPEWAVEVIEELEGAGGGRPPSGGGGPAGGAGGGLFAQFLALRDRRAWSEMYALHETMPAELRDSREVRQQLAYALNRDGRDAEAEAVLRSLLEAEGPSAETCGLLGRVYKDRWDAARRKGEAGQTAAILEQAIGAYLEGHETGERNPYPGINALTLCGFGEARRGELGRRLLAELGGYLESGDPSEYWHHATRLELALHRLSEVEADDALAGAIKAARGSGGAGQWMVETTCRNLRLVVEARRSRGAALPGWADEAIASLERAAG